MLEREKEKEGEREDYKFYNIICTHNIAILHIILKLIITALITMQIMFEKNVCSLKIK